MASITRYRSQLRESKVYDADIDRVVKLDKWSGNEIKVDSRTDKQIVDNLAVPAFWLDQGGPVYYMHLMPCSEPYLR
jgi:hypothetical protein